MADEHSHDPDAGEFAPPSYEPQHRAVPPRAGSTSLDADDDFDDEPTTRKKKSSALSFLLEIVLVIVTALGISLLVKTFLLQAFYIPSPSMATTLEVGDKIIVNKLADSVDEINRGDVIVFVDPGNWLNEPPPERGGITGFLQDVGETIGVLPKESEQHLVKRVIGVGGDQVACCNEDGLLQVNGVPIVETYVKDGVTPSNVEFSVQVPEGHVWVMGDNRSNSEDSRAHMGAPGGGFVPIELVEGRVVSIIFPFERFGGLESAESVFAAVPEG